MGDYGPDNVLLALPPGVHENSLPAIRAAAELLAEASPRWVGTGVVVRALDRHVRCPWTVRSHLKRLVEMGFVESQRGAGRGYVWRWKGGSE